MRLVEKTKRTNIIYSIVIFFLSSTVIYFIFKGVISRRQDKKLLLDKEIIGQRIKYDYPLPIFDVEDFKSSVPLKDTLYFKDTLMYQIINGVENYELYRQLTSIETLQGRTYKIITRSSIVRNREFIIAITVSVGIVILLLFITFFFITSYISNKVFQPFYKNLNTLKSFSIEENKPIELIDSDIDEFRIFNETVKKLTDKLLSDFQNLKEFTDNASHEMQTPLAIMQTKLEILMQSKNLGLDEKKMISQVYSASKRLSKLNKTLLMLAKIENQQFSNKEIIDVNEIIRNQLEVFEDFIEMKSITVSTRLTLDCKVEANLNLFETVVSNLIGNAIKHNHEKGEIDIVTDPLFFSIANTGTPLQSGSEAIFERFKKESKSSDSFGLGLAIVKKICDVYHWKITHSYSEGKHFFTIYF